MDYPGVPIRAGATGAAVTAIQGRLTALSVGPIDVDGAFGPQTEGAVRLFQARFPDAHGQPLAVDGVVGPMTWARLFGKAPAAAAAPGDPLLRRTLEVAASRVGVMEDPPGSNRGTDVETFLRSVGLGGGYAWCAAFVHWCFGEAASELGLSNPCPKTGGVLDMWAEIGKGGRLRLTRTQIQASPQLVTSGQLFFLDAGGGHGHVGFIEGVAGVMLTTVEGNTNDGGLREGVGVFRRTSRRIGELSLGVADLSRPAV